VKCLEALHIILGLRAAYKIAQKSRTSAFAENIKSYVACSGSKFFVYSACKYQALCFPWAMVYLLVSDYWIRAPCGA